MHIIRINKTFSTQPTLCGFSSPRREHKARTDSHDLTLFCLIVILKPSGNRTIIAPWVISQFLFSFCSLTQDDIVNVISFVWNEILQKLLTKKKNPSEILRQYTFSNLPIYFFSLFFFRFWNHFPLQLLLFFSAITISPHYYYHQLMPPYRFHLVLNLI